MRRVGVCCVLVGALARPGFADDPPYEPPPFTRFPDEPDLPPLAPLDRDNSSWGPAIRRAFEGTTFDFRVGVFAPLETAVAVDLVLPWRIRFGTRVGVLPHAVESAVNTQLVHHGAYSHALGELIDQSMDSMWMWQGHVTIAPWPHHGLLATVGYNVAWIHGTASVQQVADAIGMEIPDRVPVGNEHFDLRSRLRMFEAALGWEWRWHRHWSFRLDVGATIAIAAQSTVGLVPPITDARVHDLGERAEATLDHAYTTYVRSPVLATYIGYAL